MIDGIHSLLLQKCYYSAIANYVGLKSKITTFKTVQKPSSRSIALLPFHDIYIQVMAVATYVCMREPACVPFMPLETDNLRESDLAVEF